MMVSMVLATSIVAIEADAALKFIHWRLLFERSVDVNFRWSFKLDPDLGWRRLPYDHWTGRPASDLEWAALMPATLSEPISFTYDRWGYRNVSDLEQADIVLIGDSYVEGAYVSDHQTSARRLQAYLGRPVANLGVAATVPSKS